MSLPTNTTRKIKEPAGPQFNAVLFQSAEETTSATCDLCERIHYQETHRATAAGYEVQADRNPDAYTKHESPVRHTWLNGQQVVEGCPCNKLAAFESFIWDNRGLIAQYLEARAKTARAEALLETKLANRVSEATT